jgi:hypothetical protein
MPHRGKEKNEENLWMMVRIWTDWNLIREPLGTSSLKEGAAGAVERVMTARKTEHVTRTSGTIKVIHTVLVLSYHPFCGRNHASNMRQHFQGI